jgi:homoserine O-succinyltransferase
MMTSSLGPAAISPPVFSSSEPAFAVWSYAMPIKIPDQLPAREVLVREGVSVMDERTALRQDIRPLQIGLLNLMPNKIRTETQFARLIGATPLQVELTLVRIGNHKAKNTSEEHLISFYQTWEEVRNRKFDGFIVTGAPIELLPFEDVTYWDELKQIFDWTATHVHSSFFICWGAMAAAWHFHQLPKYTLHKKAFGVFRHRNNAPASPYLAGFSDDFAVPVSRWTEVRSADIPVKSGLDLLMESDVTGPCLLAEATGNRLYMFNHIEYDSMSLKEEYDRDVAAGTEIAVPHEYYPDNDPARQPLNRWRSHAHLLFGNWINQVYQTTPYELKDVGKDEA